MGFRPLDLYEKPKRATTLGINIATGLENKAVEYPIKSLHDGNKCLVLPSENDELGEGDKEFLIMPLLHQKL